MGLAKLLFSQSLIFYMPQSGVEHRVENIFARFIEIFAQCFYFICVITSMFNLKFIYTMRLTNGFNFHPTSLEFVADDNRDYRAVLPSYLAEPGLPKDVARLIYFRLKSRNGNELTFLGDVGYSREYHCKVLKSPTTGKEICYVTFRGERLLLEASVYIHAGKPVTDLELDNGRVADGRTLRQYLADETVKERIQHRRNNN